MTSCPSDVGSGGSHGRREAQGWQGAGETYLAQGRQREAADFFRRAAHVHKAASDRWHRALALDGLARAIQHDDPRGARRHWVAAVELLADYPDRRATAMGRRFTAAAQSAE